MRSSTLAILTFTTIAAISNAAQLQTRATSSFYPTELAQIEQTDLAQTSAQIATALIFGDGKNLNRAQQGFLNSFLATLKTNLDDDDEEDVQINGQIAS